MPVYPRPSLVHIAPIILSSVLPIIGCAPLPTDGTSADSAQPRQPVDVELLVNSLQCGEDIQEMGIHWIQDNTALDERYRQLNLLNPERQLSPPAVDFSTERLLVVAMGQRPTSGYLLNLPDQLPLSDGETLDVFVAWQEPEVDTVQAQVQVNPCLVLRVAVNEAKPVRVLDRDGQVKIQADG